MSEKIRGRILSVERLNSSVNGNPRYMVVIAGHGPYMTSSDAAVSYDIENLQRADKVVEWTLTRAGRILYGEVVEPINPED